MRRLAPILILAVGACAVGPGAEAVFPNRALVPHPEALFDVAPRSAALGANNASNGQPRGVPFCPRPKDLVEYQPLLAASLAAMEAGPAYSKAPRDFARALNGSAYRVLLDQDMGRAAEAIAALRAHAERNAWLPKGQEWSAAGAVIEGMGPLLPAWQILRQTSAATDADRQTIDGWLRRLAAYAAIHPGENNIGSFRGANDMLLGLMLGDDALYQQGLRSGFVRQLGAMRADGSFPMEADRGRTAYRIPAAISRCWSMPPRSPARRGRICGRCGSMAAGSRMPSASCSAPTPIPRSSTNMPRRTAIRTRNIRSSPRPRR